MSLKLVIFDVDGLLLDTERVWQDVWYDTARDFGIDDWKREDFLNVVGRSGQPVYDYMEELFRGRCSTEEFMKGIRKLCDEEGILMICDEVQCGMGRTGAMFAWQAYDIKPDIISGVSAGALAGVFYADGNEPHQVLDYFSGHKFQDLTKLVIPKKGLFDLCEFIDFLRTNVKAKNLEELQIPLIITATDLDHGRMVHFHRGSIAERVAASCCMPVMFAPVNIEGTNYVDGGLMMNLPVSTLRRICDKVVAINVSPIMAEDYKMNIVSIAMRSFHFMFRANTFPEREKCDLLIEPYNLYGYSNTELEKAEEIFEQGYNIANGVLSQLLEEKGKIWK